jgi:hypothetical protein
MEYETDGFGVIYNKVLSSHYMLSSWLRDCLKVQSLAKHGPARASVGAAETLFPGVYIQIYPHHLATHTKI